MHLLPEGGVVRWPAVAGRGIAAAFRPDTTPPEPVPLVPRGVRRLPEATVDRLAIALHDRWHGDHTPERGKSECARLAGAYDDVFVLEPLILDEIDRVAGRLA